MKQQEAQQLFAEVHRLHKVGQNNSQIAEALRLRRATVIEWLGREAYHRQPRVEARSSP